MIVLTVIVVVINVMAQYNNYNINIPEERHMDIRVRRDIGDLKLKLDDLDDNTVYAKNLYDYTYILLNNELGEGDVDMKTVSTSRHENEYKDKDISKNILNSGNVVNGKKFNEIYNVELSKTAHVKHANIDFENRRIKNKKDKTRDTNIVHQLNGISKQTRAKRQFSKSYYDNIYRFDNYYNGQSVTYSPYKHNPGYMTTFKYYKSDDIYGGEQTTNKNDYRTSKDYNTDSNKYYDNSQPYKNNNFSPYNNDFGQENNVNYNNYNQNTPSGIGNEVETTTIILESCFLCRSLGCPKYYKRVWSGCVPVDDYD
nr:TBC1 domain family member 5 homolog A isoform X1 [Plodia interpunctella]XP_053611832.1 TBC1 domain family member 5 homolog A isoform X1 [Plodia interpunctella]